MILTRFSSLQISFLTVTLLFFCSSTHAQNSFDETAFINEFKFDATAQKAFKSLTAALTALTSADSITGGSFKLDGAEEDAKDASIDVVKLWNEFPLPSQDPRFIPLLELSFSYLQFNQDFDTEDGEGDIDNWGLGAGLGLRMTLFDNFLQVTPRVKAKYGEYDFDAKLDGDAGDESLINDVLPEIDAWSYLPSVEVQLRPSSETAQTQFFVTSYLTYLYVDAESTKSSLSDFKSESWILKNALSVERPFDFGESVGEVYFRPEVARVDLYGDARDGFELNNFYELGLDTFSRSLLSDVFSELGIGARYVFEDEIHGWRVGLFGDFS